ncbi:MAG: iron uptake system protein EfeO [Pseudoxanthomonas sp.]
MKTTRPTSLRPLALLCALALAACGGKAPQEPQAAPQAAAASAVDPAELVEPIAEYKIYVTGQVQDLVAGTEQFVAAVKAGKLDEAARLYPSVRQPWERVEPIAELFSDLDAALDARADDFKGGEADPGFSGWHRLEYAIFKLKNLDGAAPIADKLLADTLELQKRIAALPLEPKPVVGGPAVLVEEVAATKISGEENRYAGTDLWDFRANIDGSQKIIELFRPLIERAAPDLLAEVDANFATVDQYLDKYRRGDGWAHYDEVTDADRNALKGAISALAEHLAQLRGALGVD